MSDADELQRRGVQLFHEREYDAAAELFQQAREAYEAAEQPDMAAEMRVNLGLVRSALNDHDQALALMQEAYQVFADIDDRNRQAQVLGNMGGVYAAQGDKEQATTCYRQAADTFLELGEEDLYGQTLIALGALQVRSGQVFDGAATYSVGLESVEKLSGPQKLLKGLFGIQRRLQGGSPRPPSPTPEDEEIE